MPAFDYLPITDAREVQAFLASVPVVVERDRFTRFVLGFPRHYLQGTPPVEIVRHFGLVTTLGVRDAASSLARDGERWKLVVVAKDRNFLFSRIAGTLTLFGADIVSAEAFGNTEQVVLDTFLLTDVQHRFEKSEEGRRFQVFLERVIQGEVDLDRELGVLSPPPALALDVEWDEDAHPVATRLLVSGVDAFGLLHAVTRRLSGAGCNIEIARIETRAGRIRDEFYLTVQGQRPGPEVRRAVEQALGAPPPTMTAGR